MTTATRNHPPTHRVLAGWPITTIVLASGLIGVAAASAAYVPVSPFDSAAFGGLTKPRSWPPGS
jgi:hypothetical protein